MKTNILVHGFYFKENCGDDLFMEAFATIFPELTLTFTNCITSQLCASNDALFIGGGSLLDAPVTMTCDLEEIKKLPIFYIGVGAETQIDPIHQDLMNTAKLIAVRSGKERLPQKNVMAIPDIVYSLQKKVLLSNRKDKSVLIVPNFSVVPNYKSDHWKHSSWTYFKSEFAQFLDDLINDGNAVDIFSMCNNKEINDNNAGIEIINNTINRSAIKILPIINGISEITKLFSSYSMIITQRYHGIVLSELCDTPYISLYHHDKLKSSSNNNGKFLSYYGMSKGGLIVNFLSPNKKHLPIDRNIFTDLNKSVLNILK